MFDVLRRAPEGNLGMTDAKRFFAPAIWGFYVLVVFEILYMISPFAMYFYSTYGPVLNVWHRSPATAWLTTFFLPHFSSTTSPVLNMLHGVGPVLITVGVTLFGIGFVQIYGAKLLRRREVTGGLYRFMRHPQYTALAILGLGTTLVWPRFLVLLAYVTMLFLYVFLARWEEELCLEKFGDGYRDYAARTGMFFPRLLPFRERRVLPRGGVARVGATIALYVLVIAGTIVLGRGVQAYALTQVSASFTEDVAVLSPAVLTDAELDTAYRTALLDPDVGVALEDVGDDAKLLVYVVPVHWSLADIPLDRSSRPGGHYVPADFDRRFYKVLFTRVRTHAPDSRGVNIVTSAYGRDPIIRADVDIDAGTVTAVTSPPAHVKWGDIPTPLF